MDFKHEFALFAYLLDVDTGHYLAVLILII